MPIRSMKTIVRPPISRILRYADPNLDITPTCTVHEPEERSAPSPELSQLVEVLLDAIQQLPVWRFVESMMAEQSRPGDGTAPALNQQGPVPAPSAMPDAPPPVDSSDPEKKAEHYRRRQEVPPAVAPARSRPVVDPAIVTRYSRCVADSQNQKLSYDKRQEALAEAQSIYSDHAGNAADVSKRAIQRSILLGQSFEKSMLELGHERPLPVPPSSVAA